MNTELRKMIVAAEGRYLSDAESSAIRAYASGLAERIAASRRMQAAEEQIVRLAEQKLGDLRKLHAGRSEGVEELRTMLRRVAMAHVRNDPEHFAEAHGEWVAEQLCQLIEPAALVKTFEALRDAVAETLSEADTYAFEPYLHAFVEELRKWQTAT
jgi:enoyl-CoA hydratase/carnithine racemase